jgi:hypothetical protein
MIGLFLANADVVLQAVSDDRVAEAWHEPSVLDDQTVGSLAGHLARGSVWAVGDYLRNDPPDPPADFESAADYFAAVASALDQADHAAIRQRGASIAAAGHVDVTRQLRSRLDELQRDLPNEPPGRLVAVFAGKVMRLDDYLGTRLVEQVVHLDDLARSLDIDPWTNAPGADAFVIGCGAEIGSRRQGAPAILRALFRGHRGVLPVL